jgi:cell division protein FtsB
MPASVWLRRARDQFGISAPRVAVRAEMPWWGATLAAALTAGIVAAVWFWGYDVRDVIGGFDRRTVEARVVTLEADVAARQRDVAALRARNSVLESELAIARGEQAALARQASDLATENGEIKDRAAFLEALVAGAGGPPHASARR